MTNRTSSFANIETINTARSGNGINTAREMTSEASSSQLPNYMNMPL